VFESDFLMSVEVEILENIKSSVISSPTSNELTLIAESERLIKHVFSKTSPDTPEEQKKYWECIVERGNALLTATSLERIKLLTDIQWSDSVHCMQYFLYYTSQYVPRIQLDLINIIIKFNTINEISVIDIGVGPGTTFVALMSLLEKYNYMVGHSNKQGYVKQINYYFLDKNIDALEVAKKHVKHYRDCFPETKIKTSVESEMFIFGIDNFNNCISSNNTIITVCNVLAEIKPDQRSSVANAFSNLPTNTSVMLAEFGGNGELVRQLGELITKPHSIDDTKSRLHITRNQLWYVYQAKLAKQRGYSWPLNSPNLWTRMLIPHVL